MYFCKLVRGVFHGMLGIAFCGLNESRYCILKNWSDFLINSQYQCPIITPIPWALNSQFKAYFLAVVVRHIDDILWALNVNTKYYNFPWGPSTSLTTDTNYRHLRDIALKEIIVLVWMFHRKKHCTWSNKNNLDCDKFTNSQIAGISKYLKNEMTIINHWNGSIEKRKMNICGLI